MTDQMRKIVIKRFNSYVDTFRDNDGSLVPMLQLKLTHTMHVVKNAKKIMQGEGWDQELSPTGEVAAILHDIGRFPQLTEFGTFQDSESIDHAERGITVIKELSLLDGATPATAKKVIFAIRWHNKKEVPIGQDQEATALAHLVRDADKLDIFRVMETAVKDGSIENNPEITWGLDIKGTPNPELVEAILNNEPVDYSLIQSLSDFILIQIGWIISGFHNQTALRIAKKRNVIEFRRNFLKSLTADIAVDQCCNIAEAVLSESADG
jgi:HD superfamily phosphohydrolase YqeK